MVSKKQKFRTVLLIIILAIAIIAGVFGVSYAKGSVVFPWEVTEKQEEEPQVAEEPEAEKVKEATAKEEELQKEVEKVEEPEEETTEEVEEEPETSVATTGVSLDYYGALHVEDGKLVDESGDVAVLTGVSSHGLSWYPEYISPETIESLRNNWGINVIRLAMYTSDYNGYCVAGEDVQNTLKDNIDAAVEAATENDMYVIIDWHILNDSNPNEYKAQAIQFFGEMVRKYEDNENVIYEICNEPNGDTTWEDICAYADEVIPVIRNVDSDAVILVGTPNWSSDLDSVVEAPLDYDNIMYTYHFYAGTHKSSARNTLTDALDAGLPVFISEYGFVSADGDGSVDTKEAAKWQDIIDEYQLSSCIWNLSNKAEGSALISSDCDKTADWEEEELSEQGQYFVNMLQSIDTSKQDDDEISDETSEDINEKEQKLNQEKSNMEKKR